MGSQRQGNEPVEIADCEAIRDSAPGKMNQGALLVLIEGEEVWIPKSQIHDNSEVYNADDHATGVLVIPIWLAIEKGLV